MLSPAHLLKMVMAELSSTFRRGSGIGALVVAVTVAAVVGAVMQAITGQMDTASVNGMPVSSIVDLSMKGLAGWALQGRNLFVLPMLLVLATASTVSGELGDQTLREALARPVPRWSVVFAKLFALSSLSAATLLATLLPALVGGAAMFGTEGEIQMLLLGYAASWASDLGLIVLTFAVASFLRNVGGVVVIIVLFLMVDMGARAALGLMGMFDVEAAIQIARMLPGEALACWEGWKEIGGFDWRQFAGLGGLIVAGLAVTLGRWYRMDVP
jgi:hypothetical protein